MFWRKRARYLDELEKELFSKGQRLVLVSNKLMEHQAILEKREKDLELEIEAWLKKSNARSE